LPEELKNNGFDPKNIMTVDQVQGSEREFVFLSLTRTNLSQRNFLQDFRRVNVALTRARFGLIIFGKQSEVAKNEYFKQVLGLLSEATVSSYGEAKKFIIRKQEEKAS